MSIYIYIKKKTTLLCLCTAAALITPCTEAQGSTDAQPSCSKISKKFFQLLERHEQYRETSIPELKDLLNWFKDCQGDTVENMSHLTRFQFYAKYNKILARIVLEKMDDNARQTQLNSNNNDLTNQGQQVLTALQNIIGQYNNIKNSNPDAEITVKSYDDLRKYFMKEAVKSTINSTFGPGFAKIVNQIIQDIRSSKTQLNVNKNELDSAFRDDISKIQIISERVKKIIEVDPIIEIAQSELYESRILNLNYQIQTLQLKLIKEQNGLNSNAQIVVGNLMQQNQTLKNKIIALTNLQQTLVGDQQNTESTAVEESKGEPLVQPLHNSRPQRDSTQLAILQQIQNFKNTQNSEQNKYSSVMNQIKNTTGNLRKTNQDASPTTQSIQAVHLAALRNGAAKLKKVHNENLINPNTEDDSTGKADVPTGKTPIGAFRDPNSAIAQILARRSGIGEKESDSDDNDYWENEL